VLGILVSGLIETIKYAVFGTKPLDGDEEDGKKVIDNIVWRVTTVVISLFVAWLTLLSVKQAVNDLALQVLFVLLNTTIPFLFYHFKGKELLRGTLGKLFDKFNKTSL
jgi:Na+/glutamate symporter